MFRHDSVRGLKRSNSTQLKRSNSPFRELPGLDTELPAFLRRNVQAR